MIDRGGACATPPYPGAVYNPDIFLEFGTRKQPKHGTGQRLS